MENQMHIWVMKPIHFMTTGETGFSLTSNFVFAYKGESFESMEVFLCIYKSAGYVPVLLEGDFLKVEKYAGGVTDLKVTLPQNIHYNLTPMEELDKSLFLTPIKIDFSFITEEKAKERAKDFARLDFNNLMSLVLYYLGNGNFKKYKEVLEKIMKYIPKALIAEICIQDFDQEGLLEIKSDYEEYEAAALKDLPEGEKRKFVQKMYKTIKDTVDQAVKDLQEKEIKEKEEKLKIEDLKKLDVNELKEKMEQFISDSKFEMAAITRDIIKEKEEAKVE